MITILGLETGDGLSARRRQQPSVDLHEVWPSEGGLAWQSLLDVEPHGGDSAREARPGESLPGGSPPGSSWPAPATHHEVLGRLQRLLLLLSVSGSVLSAGGHVYRPVGLLAGIVTVRSVPAAVEYRLLPTVGAPLLLLRLRNRLLLVYLGLSLNTIICLSLSVCLGLSISVCL